MMLTFFLSLFLTASYEALPDLEQRLAEVIQPNKEGENIIGYLEIDDRSNGINNSTWMYIHQAAESFKKTKPLFVILKLNTPGGESLSAMQICDALKELDTQFGIPVVAFIDNWAMSAGALIAYACRFITVVQDGAMGAAEPVLASQAGEMVSASEKVNSAFRITFANQASYFGRNPLIAEAMVDKDILLVKRGNEILKLSSDADIAKTDVVISPKGKLLTLTAREMIDFGVADIYFPAAKLDPISPTEREAGRWPLQKMLISNYPFFGSIQGAEVHAYQMDLKSKFFAFLMHPVVASILMLGFMGGLYLEFTTPGATLPGSIAIICLFLLGLSSFALELSSWLEMALILGGIAILLIDIFFFPTFGILGSFGVLFMIAGLLGLVVPGLEKVSTDPISWEIAGGEVLERVAWVLGTLFIGAIGLAVLAYYFPSRYNPLTRLTSQGEQEGYTAGGNEYLELLGKPGKTLSPLRPAGRIEIEGVPYDAQSDGDFVPAGTKIVVQRVEGARLFVRKEHISK